MSSPLTTLDARTLARFWAKVSRGEGCWLWNGAGRGSGYGAFKLDGKVIDAHRLSWLIEHGELPSLFVCHRCDVRLCVRPDHLFLGTNSDNMRDMVSKGRQVVYRCEAIPGARLTFDQAEEIRRLHAEGQRPCDLARAYNVSTGKVGDILSGRRYKSPANGVRPSTAALTAQDREQIRSRHVAGESIRSVARQLSIPVSTARSIVRACR